MAEKWYAVLTPAQDLDSSHWVAIERVQPGGPEAVILGLRLRQMAVQAGFGGLLAKPSGQPMSLNQITLALGYTPERVQHGLNLLHSFDLVKIDENGGVWSEDPVVRDHFSRQQGRQKLLSESHAGPGRPKKEDALSNAERQKKYKDKKNNEKVTESNGNSAIISVTNTEQQTEIVDENPGNGNSQIKEVKVIKKQQQAKPDTSVVVFDQAPPNHQAAQALMEDLPLSERSVSLLVLLAQCLIKGANPEALRHKITKAKSKDTPGAYLRGDLEAFKKGNDWDAAISVKQQQKAEQQKATEAAKRAEAARQEQLQVEAESKNEEAYRRFLSLPPDHQQAVKQIARDKMNNNYHFNPSGPAYPTMLRGEIINLMGTDLSLTLKRHISKEGAT